MRVLLVEPAKDLGRLVSQYLREQGYRVTWKTTAQDAVKAADANKPDVVVLELALPQHNGVEFLHEFRSYEDWLDIPAIIYSHIEPDRSSGSAKIMRSLGIVDNLYKPTARLQDLLGSVNKALAR